MSTHAETVNANDEQPEVANSPSPSPHASRQSLVVKRRSSGGPLFVGGALASAAAGFAIVFTSGFGRSNPDAFVAETRVAAHVPKADPPRSDSNRENDPPRNADPPQGPPRFFSPAVDDRMGDVEPVPREDGPQSRFEATPVAVEDPAEDDSGPREAPAGFSAFSEAESVDATAEPSASRMPAGNSGDEDSVAQDRGDENSRNEDSGDIARSEDLPTDPDEAPVSVQGAAGTPIPSSPITSSPTAAAQASASGEPAQTTVPSGLRTPPLESTFAAALAPVQPPASKPSAPPPSSPFEDPEAPIPVTPPGGVRAGPPAGQSPPAPAVADRPPQERIASTDVTRGFGGAPAVTPPPNAIPSAVMGGTARDTAAAAPATGDGPAQADGRPGPIQLEGVQTPQLTIEKRGPREVQVGKVARYDMVVRNVGGVSAHDVTLRDRVPLGTKLVGTSPPAAPGEAGELVWALGSLPQGGQARVAMEVMPVDEGEVGSVASVSFRADASVRSVATRAGLAIEAENPKAVLVGSAIDLAIIVRNPGTGEATGVVLEGNVPSGFTHASGPALEYDVGRLRPGETRRIDLKLSSTHPGVQTLKLSARADGRIETDHAVRLEVTSPTLELTANIPNRRYLQRPVTCVLSMNNAGTAPANTIELAAQLPPGMKFLRANNAGHYEESTHRVLWHLEQLPAAEIGNVEMVLVPTALGPQRIAAAARSADGLTAQAAHTVEVEGLAALLFDVGDSEDPIEVDGITEYVVRVGNQGTKAATGVRVTATLLGDLEPVDAKGPTAYRTENLSIRFEPLANLAPAEESVYRIRVRGRREGDQRVQVQVTSDGSQAPITKEEVTRVYADR